MPVSEPSFRPFSPGTNLFEGNGLILLLGVCITLAGIAIIGYAGSLRAQNMSEEENGLPWKDFALTKGLLVALLAGVMSACFALGLDAGTPIKEAALAGGVDGLLCRSSCYLPGYFRRVPDKCRLLPATECS